MLQNDYPCCVCEVIFSGQNKNLAKHRMHNKNVVYLIFCNSCLLNKGMNGHRDDWRHSRFERSSISEHSHSKDHDFLSHTSARSDHTRKLRESYWIRRLHTLAPLGIKQGNLLCVLSHDCRFSVLH